MRGSGTSPREVRATDRQRRQAKDDEAEADRLVTGIVDTYGHLSEDIVVAKIDQAFTDDPERRQASLDYYRSLVTS